MEDVVIIALLHMRELSAGDEEGFAIYESNFRFRFNVSLYGLLCVLWYENKTAYN